MDLQKLLDVVQVQRHDILNHLQVISGFLQLNKPDRIRDYIEHVIVEMKVMSQTSWFKIPEVTAVLLIGFNEASKYQSEMELLVESKLDECTVPGHVVAYALESVLYRFLENLASPESGNRNFTVRFEESGERHTICLCSQASCIADPALLKKALEPVRELLHKHGGESNIALSRENLEIFLDLPRKRAGNGQTTG